MELINIVGGAESGEEMGEEDIVSFSEALNILVVDYRYRLSNCEVIGILKLMSDDISEKARNDWSGPSELS